jgi:hypothetical protein
VNKHSDNRLGHPAPIILKHPRQLLEELRQELEVIGADEFLQVVGLARDVLPRTRLEVLHLPWQPTLRLFQEDREDSEPQ